MASGSRITQGAPGALQTDMCTPALGTFSVVSRIINFASETTTEVLYHPDFPVWVRRAKLWFTTAPSAGATPATVSLGIAGKSTTDDVDTVVSATNLDLGGGKLTGFAQILPINTASDANYLNVNSTTKHPDALTFSTVAGTNSGSACVQVMLENTGDIKQRYWPDDWTSTTTTTTTTTSSTA